MKLSRTDDRQLRDCCETRGCQEAWAKGAPTPLPHTIERDPESLRDGVICHYHCARCGSEWTCFFGGSNVSRLLLRALAAADGTLIVEGNVRRQDQLFLVK